MAFWSRNPKDALLIRRFPGTSRHQGAAGLLHVAWLRGCLLHDPQVCTSLYQHHSSCYPFDMWLIFSIHTVSNQTMLRRLFYQKCRCRCKSLRECTADLMVNPWGGDYPKPRLYWQPVWSAQEFVGFGLLPVGLSYFILRCGGGCLRMVNLVSECPDQKTWLLVGWNHQLSTGWRKCLHYCDFCCHLLFLILIGSVTSNETICTTCV